MAKRIPKRETINLPVPVTDVFLEQIVETAIGAGHVQGIGYWCPKQEIGQRRGGVSPHGLRGPSLVARNVLSGSLVYFFEDERESGDESKYVSHILTKDKLMQGLGRWILLGGVPGRKTPDDTWEWEIDGPRADSIIQYALFGEQKYS